VFGRNGVPVVYPRAPSRVKLPKQEAGAGPDREQDGAGTLSRPLTRTGGTCAAGALRVRLSVPTSWI